MPRPSRWNEIVDAAANAFREKGFAATSLEDIAKDVGIWKGSLYHYIDSKEALLFAVVREPAERILNALRELGTLDLPPTEKLRRAMHAHVQVLESNFVYASVYLQEIAGRRRSAEWSAMDREYVQLIKGIFREGIDRGDFSPTLEPHIATLALIGSLNWMTHWFRPEGPMSGTEIADRFCELFLGGILTRSTSAPRRAAPRPPEPAPDAARRARVRGSRPGASSTAVTKRRD